MTHNQASFLMRWRTPLFHLEPRRTAASTAVLERHHVAVAMAVRGPQGHGRLVIPQLGRGRGGRRGTPPTSPLSRGRLCPCTEGKFNFKMRMLDLKESSQTMNIYPFWVVRTQVFVTAFSVLCCFQNI